MTLGERYCDAILVRVVCDGPRPFVAGLLVDRATRRCVFAAPVLRHYVGAREDKLRASFARLGFRATIVPRSPAAGGPRRTARGC